jgi:hypothetical protein
MFRAIADMRASALTSRWPSRDSHKTMWIDEWFERHARCGDSHLSDPV